jgi:hypothetical protein
LKLNPLNPPENADWQLHGIEELEPTQAAPMPNDPRRHWTSEHGELVPGFSASSAHDPLWQTWLMPQSLFCMQPLIVEPMHMQVVGSHCWFCAAHCCVQVAMSQDDVQLQVDGSHTPPLCMQAWSQAFVSQPPDWHMFVMRLQESPVRQSCEPLQPGTHAPLIPQISPDGQSAFDRQVEDGSTHAPFVQT